mmetsp:Transcript_5553/g.8249  ORF Transcript_5553/g.8249 Transcript_5553/m.8249 type:complete len:256 (-) Transcript_5553:269-1036(-)
MHIRSFLPLSILSAFYVVGGAASCADDSTHTFNLIWDNSIAVNCTWLTKNMKQVDYRKNTYCPVQRGKCPVSCDNCTIAPTKSPTKAPTGSPSLSSSPSKQPTKAPVKAPSLSPSKAPSKQPTKAPVKAPTVSPSKVPTTSPIGPCVDSATYQWLNGLAISVDCGWLTYNPLKKTTRIATWCSNTDVSFACRSTCKTCNTPCQDVATFTFNLTNVGEPRNCSWLTKNVLQKDNRRVTYCGTIGSSCPVSCGYCAP